MCAPARPRKRTRHLAIPVLHTLSEHNICRGVRPLRCHVKNGSFYSSGMNCISMDSIIEVFYNLNKMLIATIHIADNTFVFQ